MRSGARIAAASAAATEPAVEPEPYAAWFETALGGLVWQDERAALLPLLGPIQGKAVLDAGVGEARLALELATLGARVTGVDASPPMLRLARRRSEQAAVRLPLAAGHLEALPFRTGSFDLVVAVTVLCVVPDPERAVRELARVIAPGGRLVIAELGRWSVWAAQRRLRGWLGHAQWRRTRFWTPAALARLVRAGGLEPVDRTAAVFYPPSATAGRLLRPLEWRIGRQTAVGAAFLAVAAEKR